MNGVSTYPGVSKSGASSAIKFVPASTESTYRLSIQRRPIETPAFLSWPARAVDQNRVSLFNENFPEGSTNTLEDLECNIQVRIGEPYDGKEDDHSWDYAHGFLRWEGITSCHIEIMVPAATFASLMQLAERGHLPLLEIHCISGHGLENDGPYGPMKWDTNDDRAVPVRHLEFTYYFSSSDGLQL